MPIAGFIHSFGHVKQMAAGKYVYSTYYDSTNVFTVPRHSSLAQYTLEFPFISFLVISAKEDI